MTVKRYAVLCVVLIVAVLGISYGFGLLTDAKSPSLPSARLIGLGWPVGEAVTSPIEQLDRYAGQLKDFRDFARTVPADVGAMAVPEFSFLGKDGRQIRFGESQIDASGRYNEELILANASPLWTQDVIVVCLRNFRQVPCSPSAGTWHALISAITFATLPMDFPAANGDRLDFVTLRPGDDIRPFPYSTTLYTVVGPTREVSNRGPIRDLAGQSKRIFPNFCDVAQISVAPTSTNMNDPASYPVVLATSHLFSRNAEPTARLEFLSLSLIEDSPSLTLHGASRSVSTAKTSSSQSHRTRDETPCKGSSFRMIPSAKSWSPTKQNSKGRNASRPSMTSPCS